VIGVTRGQEQGGGRQPALTRAANPARVYDFLLGGNTNYEADRQAARQLMTAKPDLVPNIRASRRFLVRVVHHVAAEAGISQFLDIGTGIPGPGMDNTHEVAQRASPAARVVYVDNDPIVLAHAHALLTSTPQGAVAFIEEDLHNPAGILRQAATMLDFAQPIAVMILGVLYMIEDDADPYGIVRQLMAATASGSYFVISHPASDVHAGEAARGARRYSQATGIRQTNRSRDEVTRFFDGLQIIPPGIVQANRWRPDALENPEAELSNWTGAGRKP
jgi:hypothetical protein